VVPHCKDTVVCSKTFFEQLATERGDKGVGRRSNNITLEKIMKNKIYYIENGLFVTAMHLFTGASNITTTSALYCQRGDKVSYRLHTCQIRWNGS
jgi:hypothetical protein